MKITKNLIAKIICTLLITMMVMPALTTTVAPLNVAQAASSSTIYVVTASSGLKLRSGPSTSSSVVTTMKKGTEVKKYGSSGKWWKVQTKSGKKGYCYPDYLAVKGSSSNSSNSSNPSGPKVSDGKMYYVSSVSNIKAYASPSTSARKLFELKGGTVLTVLKSKNGWAYMEAYNSGKRGYIKTNTLKRYSK